MGINLWKMHFELLYKYDLDNDECNFIKHFISISDDGTYSVDEEILKQAIIRAKEPKPKVPDELIKVLRKSIKDNRGSLEFKIF